MSKTLLDLLREERKEAEATPPPPPPSPPRSSSEQESFVTAGDRTSHSSPEIEEKPAEPIADKVTAEDSSTDLQQNACSSSETESITTDKQPSVSLEKKDSISSDFIVIEPSKLTEICPESKENEVSDFTQEPSVSLETETSKMPAEKEEKSLEKESENCGEKCEEITKTEKMKMKKTVRMQSDEDYNDELTEAKIKTKKLGQSVTNLENLDIKEISPGIRTNSCHQVNAESAAMMEEAWEKLQKSYVYFKGKPVGTLAAMDPNAEDLNYNQVIILFS